jgi:hypothetical protein
VAVTHDDEWMSVLKVRTQTMHPHAHIYYTRQDNEALPDEFELIKRISLQYKTHTSSGNLSHLSHAF